MTWLSQQYKHSLNSTSYNLMIFDALPGTNTNTKKNSIKFSIRNILDCAFNLIIASYNNI
jgi:hypothetical protein